MAIAIEKQQLVDLTECSICMDVYKEPRSLPCQHSFCLVCCEGFCREKYPGDPVECPVCREPFNLPQNGVNGLRKNFVLKKLTQISQSLNCAQIDLDLTGRKTAIPNFCDKHSTKTLDWYCLDCKEAMCSGCYNNNHTTHAVHILDAVTEELRVRLNAVITDLQKSYEKCKFSLTEVEKEEEDFTTHIQRIEAAMNEDAKRLHEKIDRSLSALLAEVSAKKSERLKEVSTVKQEVRQQLEIVSGLMNYTTELLKKGANGDAASEAKNLERTSNLLQSNEFAISVNELGTFTLAYLSREAELTKPGHNLIGSISPMKVKTARSLPEENAISGLTVLNKELFVSYGDAVHDIAVYDTKTYSRRRWLKVPGLGVVSDLTSCQRNQCIYLSDCKNKVIHKVLVETAWYRVPYSQWAVDDEPSGLSINSDHNLLVTCPYTGEIKEFTTDGNLVRVIELHQAGILLPSHTVQLTADKYVVCHDGRRVCIIDESGSLEKSFGGRTHSDGKLMNGLKSLSVVRGMIFVVDVGNNSVLILSPSLRYLRTVVSFPNNGPTKIWFDEQTSQLYVDESKSENGERTTKHVNVYDVGS